MKRRIYIYALLAGFAVMNSCSQAEIEAPFEEYDLRLSTSVSGMGTKTDLLDSGSSIPGNTFKLYGWENDSYWIEGADATLSSGKWSVPGSYKLSEKNNYYFLAYANLPSGGASILTPTTKDGDITFTVTDINAAQKDVLLGCAEADTPSSGNVDIDFSHPYASVKFKYGNITGGKTITALSLDGVYTGGKTTFSQSSTPGTGGVTQFTWTDLGKANGTLEVSGINATEGQDIATFVVIPQDLSAKNAVVTVTYADGGTMAKLLYEETWTAGYTTTYTLGKIGELEVSFTSSTDITINNTGETKIYVRSTITGAWYDASGNVVAPWDSATGSFTGLPGSGWTASGDTYYYGSGLASGASATKLYTSYTPGTAPVEGATLKLDVLVQAIPYDVNKTCQEAFAAL